eukprot:TRINITY_DN127_c0_g1_i4.p2 TRINITY_DN127_c0_g1~~TRINITY_DN127_c0_g1_i4.p2  ORF type:complete len:207 (+),score=104.54 TRINITY_DN127_c0_g1_i4:30-623(+)
MAEIKIVLVGVGGVGKSAVTITYVSNVWVPEYDPTIEDSHRKQVSIDEEASMLDILDTAGQEEYSSMQDQWFRTGQGFLVVYSVINRKSFREVRPLRDKIHRIKDAKKVPLVLVANKCDLEDDRVITKEEGEQLAAEFGCPYFEASAKNHVNIDESFAALVREVRKFQAEQQDKAAQGGGAAGDDAAAKKKKGCSLL